MYKNVTEAFWWQLDDLVNGHGNKVTVKGVEAAEKVTVKGMETAEKLHAHFLVQNPQQRVMLLRHRNDNIFAKIAETLWVLAGRNDTDWLAHYLPRAPEWADDGQHWRAGYGPRLRSWKKYKQSSHPEEDYLDNGYCDQISKCYEHLSNDPYTRQAVISLWNPAEDWVESLDLPCNNWLHFIIRDNQLHLAVAVRSNDILWGFSGINFFEWSVLQEAMAHWLGVEVGHLSWFASSLHLYSQHYDRADKILNANVTNKTVYDFDIPHVTFDTEFYAFDTILNEFFIQEARIREDYKLGWSGRVVEGQNAFIHTCLTMLTAYNALQQNAIGADIVDIIDTLPTSDFRVAAIEYMLRKQHKDFLASVYLSEEERRFFTEYNYNS